MVDIKEKKLSVVLVGSGAVRVNPRRGGTCQVVRVGGRNLLFDCGRLAVHNMTQFGFPVESIDEVYISHLHFDHVCDLAQLILLSWNNGRSHKMPVYGPQGIADFMEEGIRKAYAHDIASRLSHGKLTHGFEWDATEISRDGLLRENLNPQFAISTLSTEHGGLNNINYRLDAGNKRIVITSDTEPDERLIEFSRGADLLIVECSGTQEFLQTQGWGGWHMNPEEVGRLARKADVKQVVIKHLVIENFSDDPQVSEKMAEKIRHLCPSEVLVGEDGMRFDY